MIPDTCMYEPDDDQLSQMYKRFHGSLMRYLLDVNLYDVVMYFNDIYVVLIMFGRVKIYKQWDHGIAWFQFWGKQVVGGIESPLEKVIVIRVEQKQAWWFLFETFFESLKFKFGNSVPTSKNYTEAKKGRKFRKGFQRWR